MPTASDSSPSKLSPLEKLKLKRDQIDAQIKLKESRALQQARKDDTRRKIIAGALALEHTEKNPDGTFAKKMLALLDEYVISDRERKLFGMNPLPATPANDSRPGESAPNDHSAQTDRSSGTGLKDQFPS